MYFDNIVVFISHSSVSQAGTFVITIFKIQNLNLLNE